MEVVEIELSKLKESDYNPRFMNQDEMNNLEDSIKAFGFVEPVVVNPDYQIIGGHQRFYACRTLGYKSIPCVIIDLGDKNKEKLLNVALNKIHGDWDIPKLFDLINDLKLENVDIKLSGFDTDELNKLFKDLPELNYGSLSERFIVPPFSILDTRQGYWQDRKRNWFNIGIRGCAGRSEDLIGYDNIRLNPNYNKSGLSSSTSIFDPVLAEIMYSWFCPKNGGILDPMCGEDVKGIVAGYLGYDYYGVDVRKEQIDANIKNTGEINNMKQQPNWILGDGQDVVKLTGNKQFDFIINCPPYYDLEVYSDLKEDISTEKEYKDFFYIYEKILSESVKLLRDNRFAVVIVNDIRDKKGNYRNFVSDTINVFLKNGMSLYNHAILIHPAGSLPIRVSAHFEKSKKLGSSHEHVLVFLKGENL